MQKYNFYDVLAGIKTEGKGVPVDLNDPVRVMLLNKLKCEEAVAELNELEKCKNCGEVQIFDKETNKNITIKTNYGMVEGYDLVKGIETDKFKIITKKHIKNPNLNMKKEAKK